MNIHTSTRSQLLSLPNRVWIDPDKHWSHLLLVPYTKHETGWSQFAVIGCNGDEAVEVLTYTDVFDLDDYDNMMSIRMDIVHRNQCVRVWSNKYRFVVHGSFVELIKR